MKEKAGKAIDSEVVACAHFSLTRAGTGRRFCIRARFAIHTCWRSFATCGMREGMVVRERAVWDMRG
eukprot:1373070-Rhodomonas_salina.1